MLKQEKLNSAILAIQDLVIRARNFAYQNYPNEKLAEFLDDIEYLPGLILEEEDRTELFEDYLEELCTQHGFSEVFTKYKKSVKT